MDGKMHAALVLAATLLVAGCAQPPQYLEGVCEPEKGRLWTLSFVGVTEKGELHVAANAPKGRQTIEEVVFSFSGDFEGVQGTIEKTSVGPILKVTFDGKTTADPFDYNAGVKIVYFEGDTFKEEAFTCSDH